MFEPNWKAAVFWMTLIVVGFGVIFVVQDARFTWPALLVLVIALAKPLVTYVLGPRLRKSGHQARENGS